MLEDCGAKKEPRAKGRNLSMRKLMLFLLLLPAMISAQAPEKTFYFPKPARARRGTPR